LYQPPDTASTESYVLFQTCRVASAVVSSKMPNISETRLRTHSTKIYRKC